MRKYPGIPELLEQFMEEQGANDRWVTVQELRDRFGLTRYQCNTVSGFLRRLEHGSFGRFPYIVIRIEHEVRLNPSDPLKCRYLVKRKDGYDALVPGVIHPAIIHTRCKADGDESG
ncbi:MAG: hypothetical protein M0R30_11415 [Methanoregula sp.]|jgi:hypothetical protein|uniref:hypothetical protein n=1 Tax=Methanoregula sp. TaxID=2052170 RepID=UPI0025E2DAA7|nr:hypothetical protein [Methanoregula sp.]MCK9632233.1 hypothetical protein [Methanoregula sp.]